MDTGWRRDPSTINTHLLEVNRHVIKCKDIGKAQSYPPLGPHPVKDMLGMGPAVDMLMRSLETGRFSALKQFDTFRSS